MKIGLITYHSAYNFGSVLQAYATAEAISSLGHDVDIINYRMRSQKNYYSLFPKGLGIKRFINHCLALHSINKRKERQEKYERTISELFDLTEEFSEPDEADRFKDTYDVYISGSDQIWNKMSRELMNVDWRKYMSPYLLEFTDKKKISYASSIVNMSDEDLFEIKDPLFRFDAISAREGSAADRISKLLDRQVEQVIDPTLLLYKDDWNRLLEGWTNKYIKGKYIFYYSLKGLWALNRDLVELLKLKEKTGLPVVTVTPVSVSLIHKGIISAVDADPVDFLGLIKNAGLIITDSYHGTLFSLNYNKNFYSIQPYKNSNIRVEEIAELLGFSDRIIYDWSDVDVNKLCNYDKIDQNRRNRVKESIGYIDKSIRL